MIATETLRATVVERSLPINSASRVSDLFGAIASGRRQKLQGAITSPSGKLDRGVDDMRRLESQCPDRSEIRKIQFLKPGTTLHLCRILERSGGNLANQAGVSCRK